MTKWITDNIPTKKTQQTNQAKPSQKNNKQKTNPRSQEQDTWKI